MDLPGLTALVTGANGSIGSTIAERLAREGFRVRGLVRGAGVSPHGETVHADLADRDAIAAAARDVALCVHCAAERSGDADACRRTNIDGVANLADALLAGGCRLLVHMSTLSVYDDAGGPTFHEDSPLWSDGGDPYGASKAESERILVAAAARGLSVVILRPALVASMHPRSRWGPLAITRAAATSASILPFPEIPYVHVDNLADAVVRATRARVTGARAYNVIDGAAPGREYLDAVYAAIGRPAPPIPPEAPLVRYRAARIRAELGWKPAPRWQSFLDDLRSQGAPAPY